MNKNNLRCSIYIGLFLLLCFFNSFIVRAADKEPTEKLVTKPKRDTGTQFDGDSRSTMLGMINIITVADLKDHRDSTYNDQKVMLTGYFKKNLGKSRFLFEDATGSIDVYCKDHTTIVRYSMDTRTAVTIYGIVDAGTFPRSIDLKDIRVKR